MSSESNLASQNGKPLLTSDKRGFPGPEMIPGNLPRTPKIRSETEARRRIFAEHLAGRESLFIRVVKIGMKVFAFFAVGVFPVAVE